MNHLPINQVLEEANRKYDELAMVKPHIYDGSGRIAFTLGWLESSYKRVYEDLPQKLKAEGKEVKND